LENLNDFSISYRIGSLEPRVIENNYWCNILR